MGAKRRLFYGWIVVAACALGLFFSAGPIIVLSFSVFLKPLTQDFHAGRGAVSLAFALHNIISAACLLFIGRLIDRFGARRVILSGTALFALLLISSEWLGTNILSLYFFYCAIGIVSSTTAPVPYGVVVSHWFDRRRGLALGLMMTGLGLGAVTLPLVAHRLIVLFNWRTAYTVFGCATLAIALPAVATFLVDAPKYKGLLPDGDAPQVFQRGVTLDGLGWHEIRLEGTFWFLIGAFFLAGASVHACVMHMAALLTDRGVSAEYAAVTSSIVGMALLAGRLGTGYLLDRFFAPRLAMVLFGCSAAGIALLWAGSGGRIGVLAAFLIGMGMGAEADLIAYTMSRYFGLKSFGTAYGFGFAAFVFAGALGTLLMGAGFDLTHSYSVPLGLMFFAMMAALGLLGRLGPYRFAAPPAARSHQPAAAASQA
jgi:MFS family permease